MLFNSYIFMFGFLPIVLAGYFALNRIRLFKYAKLWLALSSLVFYGWWNIRYIPLILLSILFNYTLGRYLHSGKFRPHTAYLWLKRQSPAAGLLQICRFFHHKLEWADGLECGSPSPAAAARDQLFHLYPNCLSRRRLPASGT